MKLHELMRIPEEYKKAALKEQQGTVVEAAYPVSNYINRSRELVTGQEISSGEAGRKVIAGDRIVKKCNIYLPAGYCEKDSEVKYNVLYLLHGVGGSRSEWLNGNMDEEGRYVICNIFDNLIARGDLEPLLLVFPEGRSAWDWEDSSFNPEGTNMLGFYYLDYELRYDLIPFIETRYHTYSDIRKASPEEIAYNRQHRGMAGLSMGGMQVLNLVLGGRRCDAERYTGTESPWNNGLAPTVKAPGMADLFAYAGAFSNAPTSSEGKLLGNSLASSRFSLDLLYLTCGDQDGVAYGEGFQRADTCLYDMAADKLGNYYKVILKDGVHDFQVWNNGAFNFSRLCFGKGKACKGSLHKAVI